MNKAKRETMLIIMRKLNECRNIVKDISVIEQDNIENAPERLRGSSKYYKMEVAADNLTDAAEQIGYAIEHIELACGG